MDLRTACSDNGLKIDVKHRCSSTSDLSDEKLIPSESFLKAIQEVVDRIGGWKNIERWYVGLEGKSFTSLRGHLTLVNALAGIHQIEVWTFCEHPREAIQGDLPLLPEYHMEPNISTHSL